jgi:hypothetical protein
MATTQLNLRASGLHLAGLLALQAARLISTSALSGEW